MQTKFHKKEDGYTLVEMVVYVTLLSIISLVITNTLVSFSTSYRTFRALAIVDKSGIDAMERITRDIRGATDVDSANSIFGTSPGVLTLSNTTNNVVCAETFSSLGASTFTPPTGVSSVDALVVAGGGGGGWAYAGGGAGGYQYVTSYPVIAGHTYSLSVGQGGGPATSNGDGNPTGANGENGSNSFFDTIVSVGGGGGGGRWAGYTNGDGLPPGSGGSGGGGSAAYLTGGSTHQQVGGSGTAGQGNNGGSGTYTGDSALLAGGGGGGAGGVGTDGNAGVGGNGGYGVSNSITGTSKSYAGGGSGNGGQAFDGGGDSIYPPTSGSGGGGGPGNSGASGVVVLRYTAPSGTVCSDTTISSANTTTIKKYYLSDGVIKMNVDGNYFGPLTLSNASTTSLKFTKLTTSVSTAVKIDMTIAATIGGITETKSYHSTVIIK